MIDNLPDDLLVKILLLVPIKDAVATMVLSKRWLSIWTMMPKLDYIDTDNGEDKSVWQFLDKSLKLHKAPVLNCINVELGPQCPADEDVGKWIINVTDRKVRRLGFMLKWSANPIKLPYVLYTCDTLVGLKLSGKILVDIISPACLPSLQWLSLDSVIYKDEDSLVDLLSSCPVLKCLHVRRHNKDNVKTFKLKVSSLEIFVYVNPFLSDEEDPTGSLVIESPALKTFKIWDNSEGSLTIENTPCLDKAVILQGSDQDVIINSKLSSLKFFDIYLHEATVNICTTINFSQLVECRIQPRGLDWLEPVMVLLQNSPKLKLLLIDQVFPENEVSLSWNCPCSVSKCLSAHLEIFEWKEYGGKKSEKELVKYILANSRCLKRVAISIKGTCNLQSKKKMMDELESMPRISQSLQLMYNPIILKNDYGERVYQSMRNVIDTFIDDVIYYPIKIEVQF